MARVAQQHDDARPSALTERLLEQLCVGLEQDAKVRMDLEAKLERQQGEMAKLREEAVEARIQTAVQAAKEQARIEAELRIRELTPPAPNLRLSALQSRLEAMHAAKLLTDDEYFRMDDLVADFLELKASSGGGVAVGIRGLRREVVLLLVPPPRLSRVGVLPSLRLLCIQT